MLTATLEMCHALNERLPIMSFNLTPSTINDHPLFLQAMKKFDVEGLQKLFGDGLARPTDHLSLAEWGGGPTSLPTVGSCFT